MVRVVLVAVAAMVATALPAAGAPAPRAGSATFVVTTASDATTGGCDEASCTLREAITAANALPQDSESTIAFQVPGDVPVTIRPAGDLPQVVGSVTVDATTQPGYAGTPVVEVDLSDSGPVDVGAASWSGVVVFRGLAVNSSREEGISVWRGGFVLERSFVGTDVTGTLDRGNARDGLRVDLGTTFVRVVDSVLSGNGGFGASVAWSTVTIRGSSVGTDVTGGAPLPNDAGGLELVGADGFVVDNVVSGNGGHGIASWGGLTGDAPTLLGNRIGTDVTGTRPLGNRGHGISHAKADIRIGSSDEPNVIGANRGSGVSVLDAHTPVVIEGNRIGTDLAGRIDLGNGGAGVGIRQTVVSASSDSWVGGTLPASGNRIAFNDGPGIVLDDGSIGFALRLNAIHDNGGLGIDLGRDGVTPNDHGDADAGANEGQNFPVLTAAATAGGATAVTGVLESRRSQSYRVDVYSAPTCDPSGYGEAERHLGSAVVTTDDSGHAGFERTLRRATRPGQVVVATATGLTDTGEASTSELSACVVVAAG